MWSSIILLILKGHPVPAGVFFQGFSAFLETTVLCPEVLLVSGDFNFHLDDSSDADARKFMELMDMFSLIAATYYHPYACLLT